MIATMQRVMICITLLSVSGGTVSAGVILDFTSMPNGPVSTIGDVTFSLAGVGETGNPFVQNAFGIFGLWNSSDGITYPTNTILRADFSAPVSGVSFDFSPFGFNGHPDQRWTIYDSSLAVIASGAYTSGSVANYDLTAFSGIQRIEWSNGQNDWLQSVYQLSYTSGTLASVPEPSSIALCGFGACIAGFRAVRRRREMKQQA